MGQIRAVVAVVVVNEPGVRTVASPQERLAHFFCGHRAREASELCGDGSAFELQPLAAIRDFLRKQGLL